MNVNEKYCGYMRKTNRSKFKITQRFQIKDE